MTPSPTTAQTASDQPTTGQWGDQGNNTYANPILPADFSDLDAIAVGDTFYAISSTMQYSPGMTVLASKDLVNWKILGLFRDAGSGNLYGYGEGCGGAVDCGISGDEGLWVGRYLSVLG